jgi:D-3-phosphoglycerate dehydrogenase / 2-oxoglutarate reductase
MVEPIRILLADRIPATGLTPLEDRRFELTETEGLRGEALREALRDMDAVIIRSSTRITRESLADSGRLRVIGRAGVGVDNIDVEAATERGIAVFNSPSGNTISAAELAMALMLAAARRVCAADRSMRAGAWDRKSYRGTELYGKTLALIGAGRIGGEVARRARSFGMRIIAYDPFLQDERAKNLGIESVSLDRALAEADVLSLHVPLTDATENLLSGERLAMTKPGVILVNAARGGVVDELALAEALASGHVAAAGVDVFGSEPPPPDHPLRSLPNVVLTPHIGAATLEAQHNVAFEVAEAVRDALLHDDLSRAINAPAVGGEMVQRLRPLLDLASRLGRLARSLAGTVDAAEIRYAGEGEEEVLRPLTAAAMMGALVDVVGRSGVNMVNALHLSEVRGIRLSRVLLEPHPDYGEYVELRFAGGGKETRVAGALRGDEPRVVRIDAFPVDIRPRGVVLIIRNRDVPGVIGRVGTILGQVGVNIAEYHQSRIEVGGQALAAVVVDGKLPRDLLNALEQIPEVLSAHQVELEQR